jgi:hypothetical protein
MSCLTLHMTYVMPHSSHDICHAWLYTWHMSHLTLHITCHVWLNMKYVIPDSSHGICHVWLFTWHVMPDSSHDICHVWLFTWHVTPDSSHHVMSDLIWNTSYLTLHMAYVMSDSSHDICHASLFTWHMSCLTLHITYVTPDSSHHVMSDLIWNTSYLTLHMAYVMSDSSHDICHAWLFTWHMTQATSYHQNLLIGLHMKPYTPKIYALLVDHRPTCSTNIQGHQKEPPSTEKYFKGHNSRLPNTSCTETFGTGYKRKALFLTNKVNVYLSSLMMKVPDHVYVLG